MIYSYYDPNPYYQEDRKKNTYFNNAYDALLFGNYFKTQYVPYKNYVPKLDKIANDKEELCREIQAYTQASQDLKLYLDINPTEEKIYELFKNYSDRVNKLVSEYEKKYDPIFAGNSKFKDGYFSWITTPSVFYVD